MLNNSSVTTIVIVGFGTCKDYIKAVRLGNSTRLVSDKPSQRIALEMIDLGSKMNFTAWLNDDRFANLRPGDARARDHTTSPYIYEKETLRFIGYVGFMLSHSALHRSGIELTSEATAETRKTSSSIYRRVFSHMNLR